MRQPLKTEDIEKALADLRGWRHEGDALHKTFQLSDFREAMSFLMRVAFEAEEREHHPEIKNVYGKVELLLRTHDAGNKVTKADVELAQAIEAISWVA